jgi:hypothetical protein
MLKAYGLVERYVICIIPAPIEVSREELPPVPV